MRIDWNWLRSAVLGVVLAVTAIAGAGAVEKLDGKLYLVIAGRQPVSTLDPAQKYDYAIRMMEQALYDGLVKYEGNPPEVKPWLAESWEVSDDGLVWTFHLVDNAKFHNGDPVNAEAVRYSFVRTLELNKGPAWMLQDFLAPEGIEAVDDRTVRFTLKKPYAPFLSFLPWWFIVNPAIVEANSVDGDRAQTWLNENAAGSGPFKLAKFEQGKAYWLEVNKDYWKGFPYEADNFGGIIYKLVRESAGQRAALIKGEADIVGGLTPEEMEKIAEREGIHTTTLPALTAFGLKFNTQNEHMSDINVRKAIAHAFDYDGLVKIFNGEAKLQTSPFGDAIKGKIDVAGIPRRDLQMAKDYLAKSAWPDGGFDVEYVYVQGFEEERQMGLLLIDALKDLNIDVKMTPLTWPNMVGRAAEVDTAPDIIAIFATPVSTDPDAVAIQYHPTSFGKYYGSHFLEDEELKGMIEKARNETDWSKRQPIYAEIQERIVELQPEIFGMMRNRRFAFRDWVKGFQDSPIRMTEEIDLYPLHIAK
ncbi:MAG: ABC transporter substrate-binding protein [Alphaproteobacteria bacterium]|nr:ABC transporter substrate-binding protein [Alphaproteobacteria bacterium]